MSGLDSEYYNVWRVLNNGNFLVPGALSKPKTF